MSEHEGFDYGGEVAETASNFKNPTVGSRSARLFALLRVGTFCETYRSNGKVEVKPPAPQAIAVFQLLGKEDKTDEGDPMFFTKQFPLKKGDKSFLHSKFIPAMGGMSKHKGFGTMKDQLCTLSLKGGKEKNDDGLPKYINFESVSAIPSDMLEDMEDMPKYAALENSIGFLTESELTEEALSYLNPVRDLGMCVFQTEEYKAGTHPSQEVLEAVYNKNPELYENKKSEESNSEPDEGSEGQGTSTPAKLPTESLEGEEEF